MKKIISFAALVLLLTLASCAVHPEASGMAEKPDLVPMVRVEGTLYRDTGNESQAENHSGTRAGKITSTVSADEKPTVDDQSNFGTGYEYQIAVEGTIEIFINDRWFIFAAEGNGSD
ncbi:hypothetical protein [Holdemania filiformis]|uniref:Lipoprotein n=1 Tax=Holdemania filiformis TaxID=61171 RepID=A0A412FW95_9FIRM|nr:hypothetical protein [Holdemania filiformis]MBS5003015.1 hypothetical protein [Holdemania filiformis]RGR72405.1 hypothetical protein DWY25_12175 [Holdemania filiformis]